MDYKRLVKAILLLTSIVSAFIGVAYLTNIYKETFNLIANISLVGFIIIFLIGAVYHYLD